MGLWNNPPYYLTAYGLAVKHGFIGTEEKWLESLKGEPGTGLEIVDSFDSYEEMIERYPGTVGIPEGFIRVGPSNTDYLLYYWDSEDQEWYSISIIGARGENGRSAYEIAVEGGYQGTEEEFEQQLANFNIMYLSVVSNAEQTRRNAQTAADASSMAVTMAATASDAKEEAQAAATAAAASQSAASQGAAAAEDAAYRAEHAVGDAAWLDFQMDESGWLVVYTADSFSGADFSVNDEGGAYQGWLEVSYTE